MGTGGYFWNSFLGRVVSCDGEGNVVRSGFPHDVLMRIHLLDYARVRFTHNNQLIFDPFHSFWLIINY